MYTARVPAGSEPLPAITAEGTDTTGSPLTSLGMARGDATMVRSALKARDVRTVTAHSSAEKIREGYSDER
jgi:hypothetical protein